jgi:hypothetical protein
MCHAVVTRDPLNILLGDFNAKVGREDIFKPTIGMIVYMKLVMIMELE